MSEYPDEVPDFHEELKNPRRNSEREKEKDYELPKKEQLKERSKKREKKYNLPQIKQLKERTSERGKNYKLPTRERLKELREEREKREKLKSIPSIILAQRLKEMKDQKKELTTKQKLRYDMTIHELEKRGILSSDKDLEQGKEIRVSKSLREQFDPSKKQELNVKVSLLSEVQLKKLNETDSHHNANEKESKLKKEFPLENQETEIVPENKENPIERAREKQKKKKERNESEKIDEKQDSELYTDDELLIGLDEMPSAPDAKEIAKIKAEQENIKNKETSDEELKKKQQEVPDERIMLENELETIEEHKKKQEDLVDNIKEQEIEAEKGEEEIKTIEEHEKEQEDLVDIIKEKEFKIEENENEIKTIKEHEKEQEDLVDIIKEQATEKIAKQEKNKTSEQGSKKNKCDEIPKKLSEKESNSSNKTVTVQSGALVSIQEKEVIQSQKNAKEVLRETKNKIEQISENKRRKEQEKTDDINEEKRDGENLKIQNENQDVKVGLGEKKNSEVNKKRELVKETEWKGDFEFIMTPLGPEPRRIWFKEEFDSKGKVVRKARIEHYKDFEGVDMERRVAYYREYHRKTGLKALKRKYPTPEFLRWFKYNFTYLEFNELSSERREKICKAYKKYKPQGRPTIKGKPTKPLLKWYHDNFIDLYFSKSKKLNEKDKIEITKNRIEKKVEKIGVKDKNVPIITNNNKSQGIKAIKPSKSSSTPIHKANKATLLNFLESKKEKIQRGEFYPNKDNIVNLIPELKGYRNLNNIIYRWFQENTPYKSLTHWRKHFEGLTITEKLNKFLESKINKIDSGDFIPSKENIIKERPEFKDFKEINNRISKWLKKNTEFSGVKEIRQHFKGIPHSVEIYNFLESKKEEILNGKFIPDSKTLLDVRPDLKKIPNYHVIVYKWIKENTQFDSLTQFKENIEGKSLSQELWDFLDSKRIVILSGDFIPNKKNIIREVPEIKNYDSVNQVVLGWLKKNSEFRSIRELRENFNRIRMPNHIRKILDKKKESILKGKFIPTKRNLEVVKKEIGSYSHTNDVINNWLIQNTKFKNLKEYLEYHKPSPYSLRPENIKDRIRKALDSKKEEILKGKFFPTVKNFRKIDPELANYKFYNKVVSSWIYKKSKKEFRNLEHLITHFDPLPNSIGSKGRHGYTANFENIKYRIKNAINQTVKIVNDKTLSTLDTSLDKKVKSWKSFFNFIKTYSEWKLIDLLTGEVITESDFKNQNYAFHHIDGDKTNDDKNNLVFLLPHNHSSISLSQIYFPELADFFETLLNQNFKIIKNGKIPLSWRINWKILAKKKGLRFPKGKYGGKILNKTIFQIIENEKRISDWL